VTPSIGCLRSSAATVVIQDTCWSCGSLVTQETPKHSVRLGRSHLWKCACEVTWHGPGAVQAENVRGGV
jgi:hypothetical protein